MQNLSAKGESKRATTAHVGQLKIWKGFYSPSDDESSDSDSEMSSDGASLPADPVQSLNNDNSIKVSSDLESKELTHESQIESVRRSNRVTRRPLRLIENE